MKLFIFPFLVVGCMKQNVEGVQFQTANGSTWESAGEEETQIDIDYLLRDTIRSLEIEDGGRAYVLASYKRDLINFPLGLSEFTGLLKTPDAKQVYRFTELAGIPLHATKHLQLVGPGPPLLFGNLYSGFVLRDETGAVHHISVAILLEPEGISRGTWWFPADQNVVEGVKLVLRMRPRRVESSGRSLEGMTALQWRKRVETWVISVWA